MKLCFTVEESSLTRQDENIVVSYGKNANKCVFHCDHFWKNLYKKALFTDYKNKQYIVLLGTGKRVSCNIPNEVLQGNLFYISVFGEELSISYALEGTSPDRYTTTQETIYIQPSGFTNKTEEVLENGDSEVVGDSTINDFDVHRFNNCNCRSQYYYDAEHLYY